MHDITSVTRVTKSTNILEDLVTVVWLPGKFCLRQIPFNQYNPSLCWNSDALWVMSRPATPPFCACVWVETSLSGSSARASWIGLAKIDKNCMKWTKVTSTTQLWIQWSSWCMLIDAVCWSVLPPASQISAWTILPSGLVSNASETICHQLLFQLPKHAASKVSGAFWSSQKVAPRLHCWGNDIPGSSTYTSMCKGYAKLVLPCFALLSVATMPCWSVCYYDLTSSCINQPLEGSWHSPMFLMCASRFLAD